MEPVSTRAFWARARAKGRMRGVIFDQPPVVAVAEVLADMEPRDANSRDAASQPAVG